MSTFLAALPQATLVLRNSVIWEFSESGGGFGYTSQKIEIIILLQAAAASTTQELLVSPYCAFHIYIFRVRK